MANKKELYLCTDFRLIAVSVICEMYCKELTCLKMSLILIVSLNNFLTRGAIDDAHMTW